MKTHRILLAYLLLSTAVIAAAPSTQETIYVLPMTGVNVQRVGNGWLNLEASGTRLVVKFYDRNKKPMQADVERGFSLFSYASKKLKWAPLNPEGDALVTPAKIKPPHNFLLIISLFVGGDPEAAEFYTVKYP